MTQPTVFCDEVRMACSETPPCCMSCHSEWHDEQGSECLIDGDEAHGLDSFVCCTVAHVQLTEEQWAALKALKDDQCP